MNKWIIVIVAAILVALAAAAGVRAAVSDHPPRPCPTCYGTR
jgi:hypothetical protein